MYVAHMAPFNHSFVEKKTGTETYYMLKAWDLLHPTTSRNLEPYKQHKSHKQYL